jgi:hypothetical protein
LRSFFRVFPYLPGSALAETGGPLYLPQQGAGRIDNPALYSVLYLSNSEAGAIAESFGRLPEWSAAMLAGHPAMPGSTRAVATFTFSHPDRICDLDDPAQLQSLDLRPSQVVSRDYAVTRAWARHLYRLGRWQGVSWWSYYDSRWTSIGLWNLDGLTVETIRPISIEDAALGEAGRVIARRIVTRSR